MFRFTQEIASSAVCPVAILELNGLIEKLDTKLSRPRRPAKGQCVNFFFLARPISISAVLSGPHVYGICDERKTEERRCYNAGQ
jgi:hypothetical protein